MTSTRSLRQAVRFALATVTASAGVVTGHAQTAPAQPAEAPTAAPLAEIIVTGSRIVEPGLTSISPVTTVSAAEVQQSGVTRVEDLLNTMPQIMADQGAMASNGSTGEATVNLRGLGPQRTLVLINGRRLMPGDPTAPAVSAPDINNIPAALVERIDVLTGGASSTYGADAVAGVVNFVMNDHFEGLKVDLNGSIYQHNQHNGAVTAAVTKAQAFGNGEYGLPPSSVADGAAKDVTILFGKNLADGAGNFTAYAGYRKVDPVLQSARDFSACTPNVGNAPFACFGSSNGFPGRFFTTDGTGAITGDFTVGPGGTFAPFTSAARYNFAPTNYFQRPDERWTAGEFLHLELSDKMQVYNEFMFMRDVSVSQVAPSAAFLGSGTALFLAGPNVGVPDGNMQVNCANPYLSAQELAQLTCVNGNAQFLLGRRNVEGGPRIADLEHTSYRIVVGLKGEFADGWRYDTYAMEGQTAFSSYGTGNLSKTNMTNALNVVNGPNGPVCANAAAVGCVPWNIFSLGGVTPAALNYIDVPLVLVGYTEERVWDGNITGDLGKYGVKSPAASDGMLINFGAQYRSEGANLHPDAAEQNDDISGAGGPVLPLNNAGFHVWEGYLELGMPLLQDQPMAKELSFEAGYRYSGYTLAFGDTNTYKFGLNWAPTSDIRFRGSYQRAVRAPNLQELFVQKGLVLEGTFDPCAGSTTGFPTATAAQCANTHVTNAQYGKILPSPAAQYQGLTGGNPNVKPEQADTVSFGFVLTPTFAPGLNLQVDYFDIKIKNTIGVYGFTVALTDCLQNATPYFCNNIHRDSIGTLWASPLSYIYDPTLNEGGLQSQGVDITARYALDLNRMGRLNFSLSGTYTTKFITELGPEAGSGSYNCAGYYGPTCLNPQPKWKHVFTTTWDTPVQGLQLGARWRYNGRVTVDELSPNPLLNNPNPVPAPYNHLGSYGYIDLTGDYQINKALSFRLGINNVADKDPPYVSGLFTNPPFNNGNTYPQVYDALGRYIFANLTLTF